MLWSFRAAGQPRELPLHEHFAGASRPSFTEEV
jgi:hypothetical protein